MRLIIATSNVGKLKEIKKILRGIPYPIISLSSLKRKFHIKETAKTFHGNALKKALAVSRFFPEDLVVGEDSGLEVDYLNGAPGVFSKRYSGKGATDLKNNKKLLNALAGLKKNQRQAQFHCSLVLAKGPRSICSFEGRVCGRINDQPKGARGFGYDPVFYLPGYKKTVAQLSLSAKNRISHRAKAFKKLKQYLKKGTDTFFNK